MPFFSHIYERRICEPTRHWWSLENPNFIHSLRKSTEKAELHQNSSMQLRKMKIITRKEIHVYSKARESHAHYTNMSEALVERELNSRMWGVRDEIKLEWSPIASVGFTMSSTSIEKENFCLFHKAASLSVSPTLTQYSLYRKWSVFVLLLLLLCLSPKFYKPVFPPAGLTTFEDYQG